MYVLNTVGHGRKQSPLRSIDQLSPVRKMVCVRIVFREPGPARSKFFLLSVEPVLKERSSEPISSLSMDHWKIAVFCSSSRLRWHLIFSLVQAASKVIEIRWIRLSLVRTVGAPRRAPRIDRAPDTRTSAMLNYAEMNIMTTTSK